MKKIINIKKKINKNQLQKKYIKNNKLKKYKI